VKAYVAFVLVFLIIASVIAIDAMIYSMAGRDGGFVAGQAAFNAAVDANMRIEESAAVGSATGISLYVAYKTAQLAAETAVSAGTLTVEEVARSLDLNEMKKWSNAGVLVALDMMAHENESNANGKGFYCTWATGAETDDAMSATVSDGILYLPPKAVGLNTENCWMVPHTSISAANLSDMAKLASGNLSAMDIEVSLYDEESAENGFRTGRIAHLYYDKMGRVAGLSGFPPSRSIRVLSLDESALKGFMAENMGNGWESALAQHGIYANSTFLASAVSAIVQ
jgi:hypothetical protein